mmetsp:Transcript_12860/g.37047  ORF Transcript_12860/g.37047 Transcript_12860/m.37047 type:complete len:237 (-) Transcript_12860:460-1170(-)
MRDQASSSCVPASDTEGNTTCKASRKSCALIGRNWSAFKRATFAEGISRRARIEASLLRSRRSLEENLAVRLAISTKSASDNSCRCFRMADFNICSRAASSGNCTCTWIANLRSTASSKSNGRFVAARTTTRWTTPPAAPLPPSRTPSIWTKNSVFNRRAASLSEAEREESTESTSSKKTTLGALEFATLNKAFTIFSDSPCHFDVSEDADTAKNDALHSAATALARKVLPLPGGP